MCAKSSDESFRQIVRYLKAATSLLTVTHVHPDGDGLGSMMALAGAAEQVGKTAHLLTPNSIPAKYAFLLNDRTTANAERFADLAEQADVIVVLDTCSVAQLEPLQGEIRRYRDKVLVIDHHATLDDVGIVQWVDTSAAAVGVMVGELLEALDWPIDVRLAEALATAVLTDTGWLRFANTDARCLRLLATWLEMGVQADVLYQKIYQSDRLQRLRLASRLLAGLQLHCEETLAVMTLGPEDFARTGATKDETENLINEALRIASVEVAVLVVEQNAGLRVSLRSRKVVDVAELAQRFGGGGHSRAAGFRSKQSLAELLPKLLSACTEAMRE